MCEEPIGINYEAVGFGICNRWVRIRCNNIGKKTYRGFKKDPTPSFCKSFMQEEIFFSNINDTEYTDLTNDLKVKPRKIIKETIFENLNLFSDNESVKCKYYTNEPFKKNVFDKYNNQVTLLHLNISTFLYNIE